MRGRGRRRSAATLPWQDVVYAGVTERRRAGRSSQPGHAALYQPRGRDRPLADRPPRARRARPSNADRPRRLAAMDAISAVARNAPQTVAARDMEIPAARTSRAIVFVRVVPVAIAVVACRCPRRGRTPYAGQANRPLLYPGPRRKRRRNYPQTDNAGRNPGQRPMPSGLQAEARCRALIRRSGRPPAVMRVPDGGGPRPSGGFRARRTTARGGRRSDSRESAPPARQGGESSRPQQQRDGGPRHGGKVVGSSQFAVCSRFAVYGSRSRVRSCKLGHCEPPTNCCLPSADCSLLYG